MPASPVCGPSWIYPRQPNIWVVPCTKSACFYKCFEINLDTEFVLCKQQIHHKVANIPLIRVPNMANISLWSSPTLHRSALNIAEFLHFISQIAFVKNKFASYLALKSTKLCDFSLVFLSPFLEIYYSNSIKWPTLPLSLLQALTPPFDPHHNLNSLHFNMCYNSPSSSSPPSCSKLLLSP